MGQPARGCPIFLDAAFQRRALTPPNSDLHFPRRQFIQSKLHVTGFTPSQMNPLEAP